MKYGNYPVDHSSGVPKVDIPLYEIKAGALTLPIGLSYHASGIRVNEVSTSVGLGWSLQAGGMVSRVINNLPDEQSFLQPDVRHLTTAQIEDFPPTPDSDPLIFRDVCEEIRSLFFNNKDTRADDYFYAAGGKLSGQFTYDIKKQLHLLSFSNDSILRKTNGGTVKFEITGDDGTRYLFDDDAEQVWGGSSLGPYPSSWMLTRIISAANTDTIYLEYNHFSPYSYVNKSFATNYVNQGPVIEPVFNGVNYTANVLIKKISYRGGSVVFNYAADRKDIVPDRLTSIIVNRKDEQNIDVQMQKYELVHLYFTPYEIVDKYSYRLQLAGIKVYDGSNRYVNSYGFSYDQQAMPPMPHTTTDEAEGCAQDYWGYYNGQNGNPHLIPFLPPNLWPSLRQSANRTANETNMKACSLNRIDYPTGGYTLFDFEANREPGQAEILGGLRIKKITSVANADATPVVKQYVYEIGNVLSEVYRGVYSYTQYVEGGLIPPGGIDPLEMDLNFRVFYFSNPIIPLANHSGAPLIYTFVSEITDDNQGSKRQTDYLYSYEDDRIYAIDNLRYQNKRYNKNARYPEGFIASRPWTRGMPASVNYYKYNGTAYKLSKSIVNEYVKKKEEVINTGMIVNEKIQRTFSDASYSCGYEHPGRNNFYFFDVLVDGGVKKLSRTTETDFNDDGTALKKVTDYAYGSNKHLYPTSITTNTSNGGNIVENLKYVSDVTQNGGAESARQQLVSINNVAPVLSRNVLKNGIQISDETINYAVFNGNQAFPGIVTQVYQTGGQPVSLSYSDYDKWGNLKGAKRTGDLTAAYIYGYNGLFLVAETRNADPTDIAYTSFEGVYPLSASGKDLGNWQNTNGVTSVVLADAFTGNRVGVLNSTGTVNGLSKTGLSSSRAYVITAWVKNTGSVLITPAATSTILSERNGWKLWSWLLPATTTVTLSAGIAGTQIDELRLYPENAMMKTASYLPQIGVSSECGANNKITYYEYDDFQRLSTIRDQNRNILKQICYKYANNATTLCAGEIGYYSNQLDSGFKKTCSAGGVSDVVTYTVPSNKYSSGISQADADLQAMREMTDSGQVYANRMGQCRYLNDAMEKKFPRTNCGANQVATSVVYRVADAKYTSNISKADANAKALADINSNGPIYANTNGTCYPANTTFVRILYENYDRSNSDNVKADVVVRFYSDYEGTIPKSVSNLTINYKQIISSGDNESTTIHYTNSVTGSSKVLMSQASLQRYDPAIGDYWWTSYALDTGNYWILNF